MPRGIVGPLAKLVRYDGVERFDVLPLLVATDGAIAAFGHDHRRLRPNIVIGGVEGLAELEWPGGCLRIGQVLIGVQDLRLRCIMTAYDPDTLVRDKEITRNIYRRFDDKLALNCFVIEGGDTLCLPSSTVQFTLSVTEVALVDRTLPTGPKGG